MLLKKKVGKNTNTFLIKLEGIEEEIFEGTLSSASKEVAHNITDDVSKIFRITEN